MTAEIAILNKEAVALAADSAVTSHVANEKKIFTSGNKLFALSYKHPVGIMVYNSAYLLGVPWETIIKSYRNTIPSGGFEKLEQYTEHFLSFLANSVDMFSVDAQTNWLISYVSGNFISIKKEIENRVKLHIARNQKIDDITTNKIVSEVIEQNLSKWSIAPNVDGHLAESVTNEVIKRHEEQIKKMIPDVFQRLPLSGDLINKLMTLASNIVAKGINDRVNSGVVLAGFGEREFFPSLQSFVVEGIIDNKLSRGVINTCNISITNPGRIIPFAQSEMVERFMFGVDPKYKSIQQGYISELCKDYAEKVVGNIKVLDEQGKQQLKMELLGIGGSLAKDFEKKVHDATVAQFFWPIIGVIAALPKNELAIMAEALVSITSLKRQFSPQEETVKEPIDVVCISKGDGFIWIKRKHYFKPELNPHYFIKGVRQNEE